MPPPRKTGRPSAWPKASRPDLQPLDEHLAALLNPALVETKPQGFGEAPQQRFESPAPDSHPRGLTHAGDERPIARSAMVVTARRVDAKGWSRARPADHTIEGKGDPLSAVY